MKYLLGCDPEFFLKQNGKHISAEGIVGGTKHAPLPIDNFGNAIQEDNVAVEFNIGASPTFEMFSNNIQKVLDYLKDKLHGFEFSTESAVIFDDDQLDTAQARLFGCEPDFNAWTHKVNPKPFASNINLRSAGGHIHIGCAIAQEKPEDVIKACDLFLGVPSVILDPNPARRELYGKAGSFRKKSYGVEYRSLSNFWIFDKSTRAWVYKQVDDCLTFVANGNQIDPLDHEVIQNCINNSNKDYCNYLMDKYKLCF